MGKIIQKPSRRKKFFKSGLGEFLRLDRNHADRLLDYFRRYPDLRMEVIESIYLSAARSRQAPTRREMIAELVMLASAQPIDQTLRRLERFSLEGWSDCFDDEFFNRLEAESHHLRRVGFFRDARNLIKVGTVAARMHNQNEWADRLNKNTSRELGKQIADQPFLKQSGW